MCQGCHSDSGFTHQPRGFYAQLIYGESFEGDLPLDIVLQNATAPTSAPTSAPTKAFKRFSPMGLPALGLRHCDYELFATRANGRDDFRWLQVPAINGAKVKGAISFQSRNYPTHFMCPFPNASKHGLEPNRLGSQDQDHRAPVTCAEGNFARRRRVADMADNDRMSPR